MGKLLRKKPADKKKKKKADDDVTVGSTENETSEKKIISLTDFSRDKKKQISAKVRPVTGDKPLKPVNEKLEKVLQFLREVKIELKKVTWPSRAQTLGSTVVVILLVMILSLFLGLVDAGLNSVIRLVLH